MYGHVKAQGRETFREVTWQHMVEEIRKWGGDAWKSITIYRRRFVYLFLQKRSINIYKYVILEMIELPGISYKIRYDLVLYYTLG